MRRKTQTPKTHYRFMEVLSHYICIHFLIIHKLHMVFCEERIEDVYTSGLLIFWLYNCYFGKIKVCVVLKVSLHGFHLIPIIS